VGRWHFRPSRCARRVARAILFDSAASRWRAMLRRNCARQRGAPSRPTRACVGVGLHQYFPDTALFIGGKIGVTIRRVAVEQGGFEAVENGVFQAHGKFVQRFPSRSGNCSAARKVGR